MDIDRLDDMIQEKGNAALIVLLLILVIGLVVALYLVQQQTNLFPKAYSPTSTQINYHNPFDQPSQSSANTSIFSGYKNPFEGLK